MWKIETIGGTVSEIEVGEFMLREMENHKGEPAIWIEWAQGEGMQVSIESLESLIRVFYNENF